MKKPQTKKLNTGITLISLAVTVVVLMILAGVSISTILGDDGVITKAQEKAEATKQATTEEELNRMVLEYELARSDETMYEYFERKKSEGKISDVIQNDDGTITIKKDGYSITVKPSEKTPKVKTSGIKVVANSDGTGEGLGTESTAKGKTLYITFTHSITGGTTTVSPSIPYAVTENGKYNFTVTGTVDGKTYTKNVTVTVNQFKKITLNDIDIKIGDYVNYTYDTASSYTLSSTYSGDSNNQSIAQTTGLKWKVLNVDKENDTVDIISENPTSATAIFQGVLGYSNGPYLMNEICKAQYSNKTLGTEARSINLLDMEKHLTSTGITARNAYTSNVKYGTTKTYTTNSTYGSVNYYPSLYAKQKGAGINTTSITQPDITKGNDPYNESETGTTGLTTDGSYGQASSSGLTVTQTYYNIAINTDNYGTAYSLLNNSNTYWVAARFVDTYSSNAYFGLRYASASMGGAYMFYSNSFAHGGNCYLRPLVSLKSNILTGTKDSSGAWNLKTSLDDGTESAYMKQNTQVTYPDGTVWVPEGFKIAADSASTVQGGVVIEDKDQNQFVWIPVASISDYKRIDYDGSLSAFSETLPSDEKTSIETYKGYYIGRYEAGDKESTAAKNLRESDASTSNTTTIKANQAPYNYVTRTQAKLLAENFGTQQNYNTTIKTKLVSSYAWDTAIAFIQKSVSNYGNSSTQGNYYDTTFNYTDITGATKTKSKSSSVLIPTGQTTSVCNIYDMGGNIWEYTTETCSSMSDPYTGRGGTYENSYTNISAGSRNPVSVYSYFNVGFRLTLFL